MYPYGLVDSRQALSPIYLNGCILPESIALPLAVRYIVDDAGVAARSHSDHNYRRRDFRSGARAE